MKAVTTMRTDAKFNQDSNTNRNFVLFLRYICILNMYIKAYFNEASN